MKWFREIRKVGIVDWLWFVVWLGRNEFHHRLDMTMDHYRNPERLVYLRNRAHRIDAELSE